MKINFTRFGLGRPHNSKTGRAQQIEAAVTGSSNTARPVAGELANLSRHEHFLLGHRNRIEWLVPMIIRQCHLVLTNYRPRRP
jgi:hypothetical protein